MTAYRVRVGFVLALIALSGSAIRAVQVPATAAKPATAAAAAAVKASPELVGALSKEIGASPEQAAGAAGALFAVAKSRLSANEFAQVAKAVPGMDSLLAAAPAVGGGMAGAVSKVAGTTGSANSLATAAAAFSKLGLQPDLVAKAVPVLTSFVTKSGGAAVGGLLGGALK